MVTWRNLDPSELTRPTNCKALPRVVEADGARSLADLRAFVTAERKRLRDEMLKRGGFLLRGFEVNDPTGFADIISALGYQAEAENQFDTSPRSKVAESVYTSTDTPDAYPILAHNENSFLNERPRMIPFFCLVEPHRYGETPLFNSRAAADTLAPEVRAKLEEKKVCYRRRFPKKRPSWAPMINRDWQEAFGTTDRDEIDAMVTSRGMTCHWHDNGRILHTENVVNPLPRHPDTGDRCLNLQAFHRTSILQDLDEVDRVRTRCTMPRSKWASACFTPSRSCRCKSSMAMARQFPPMRWPRSAAPPGTARSCSGGRRATFSCSTTS